MASAAGPNTVEDGLILNIDPINLEKNLTSNTSTNFLQNGSFSGGLGVSYEAGSNPTNTIIELENPGDSQYVLRQNGNQPFSEGVPEYQMNIDGGAQGTLSASTQYVMSGWYATSDDYNGGDTMFHARAFSTGGSHNATGNGIGTLLYSKVVGGLTWEFRYQTITTPSDYSGDFDWYMGYGTQNTAGYRYYTGLKVEEGSFPSALDLSRNGNEGKVKGASFSSDGYFDFDGSDDYIPLVDNFGDPQQFTVEFWAYPTQLDFDSNNNYRRIFVPSGASTNGGNCILIEQGGNISFRVPGGTTNNMQGSGVSGVNQWGHVVCTYDQSNKKIYFNGSLKSTVAEASVTVDFGSPQIVDPNGQTFKGRIANAKVYNKALSASEISQNFNALRGRFGL